MATTTDDFTFPVSVDANRRFMESPPLWQFKVSTEPIPFSGEIQPRCSSINTSLTHHVHRRKSFSDEEEGDEEELHRKIERDGEESQRSMDLLWEDFNEEKLRNQTQFMCSSRFSEDNDSKELVEFGCVPTTLNLSRAVSRRSRGSGGGCKMVVARNKKIGLLLLSKVLKRLFLPDNNL